MNFKRIFSHIFLLFFAFSISILVLCIFSEKAAYLLNYSLAFHLRHLFASLFSLIDFSLFEILVVCSPILIFLAVYYVSKAERAGNAKRRFVLLISLFSILPSSYVFMIAIPNVAPSLYTVDTSSLEDADFVKAARILADGVNELSDGREGSVSYSCLSDAMTESYSTIFSQYGLSCGTLPKPKPIRFSKALSYTGALAIYSPPTGEININTEIPSYMMPFTVAHEYAHYLGIGGEGDANLLAFVCCEGIDDPTVRYSSRLVALEYVLSDLYKIDREMYTNIYNSLNFQVREDIKEHREYSKRYESRSVFRFFESLNSSHGAAWDTDGESSYSATAKKIVHYFKNNQKPKV